MTVQLESYDFSQTKNRTVSEESPRRGTHTSSSSVVRKELKLNGEKMNNFQTLSRYTPPYNDSSYIVIKQYFGRSMRVEASVMSISPDNIIYPALNNVLREAGL